MEEVIHKAGRKLRLGYTTGSCATLASKAAALMLLSGDTISEIDIVTPKGIRVQVPVENIERNKDGVRCAVRKDAGDDPDVTNGMLVVADVQKTTDGHVTIDGGHGVGRVTRKGLDQPVGAAAINRVPRQMIHDEVTAVCEDFAYEGGLAITISIPGGEEIAAKTFNPQLGIEGGLSVIGTSGIVEPMSTQALLDTIDTEMRMHYAEGARGIVLTPGNYGQRFLAENPAIALRPIVKCSNFIGDALDMAALHGFTSVLVVGHIGKLVKLAGGVMDTHSQVADVRLELLALHAFLAGGDKSLAERVLHCISTDEALEFIDHAGCKDEVMHGVLRAAETYLTRRADGAFAVGVSMFSFAHGPLGISAAGEQIVARWRANDD